MAHLYLTRKLIQFQQSEGLLDPASSNAIVPAPQCLRRMSSYKSGSLVTSNYWDDDVEDLEMLLEAYFMQLDGTRNKILSVSISGCKLFVIAFLISILSSSSVVAHPNEKFTRLTLFNSIKLGLRICYMLFISRTMAAFKVQTVSLPPPF